MKHTTTINGTTYTFKKFEPVFNWKDSIFDLYEKPSKEKRDAFKKWEAKLDRIYWLVGGKQNYSIFWEITDESGERHAVKITKSNAFIL
jgi:hypothetical protein